LWFESGDAAGGTSSFQEAIRIQPTYAEAHKQLRQPAVDRVGRFFRKQGVSTSMAALRLSRSIPRRRYNYGRSR